MAEIQESGNKKDGKSKQKKMTVRVDFTPMVDMMVCGQCFCNVIELL